jgi:hypothetical protein
MPPRVSDAPPFSITRQPSSQQLDIVEQVYRLLERGAADSSHQDFCRIIDRLVPQDFDHLVADEGEDAQVVHVSGRLPIACRRCRGRMVFHLPTGSVGSHA